MVRNDLRNIAIIAHVDHGKTTLVDQMLKQGGAFRKNQVVEERVMDSNDLERERGITILAKNTSVHYKDTKINIVDTPGHADFSGEVERILKMVDGVILLVDAFEGPMPQTRFVLEKALEFGHKIIIVINKIDRPDARLSDVGDEVLELLLTLDANDEQLDSPILYCSGRDGTASLSPNIPGEDLTPLFETILNHIPAPHVDTEGDLQMLVSSIDYNDYVGRIAIGRVERGTMHVGQDVTVCNYNKHTDPYKAKIASMYTIDSLGHTPVEDISAGDIVCVSGIENVTIGDTLCAPENPKPLPFVKISEPTVEMYFSVNDSPFAGREGKYVTSRQLRERLHRELLKDVSLRVHETENTDTFRVAGRGEMHLSILIETLRREGYEFQVGAPRALYKIIDGKRYEPIERMVADVPADALGSVMEKMGARKGELQHMAPQGDRMRVEFLVPARGLFGYKNEFLTDTKGEGILSSVFYDYQPYKGEISKRSTGSLIAFETGTAVAYGLFNAQERGQLFIGAGTEVYEGMIVGVSPKNEDMAVNVCKKKQLTNMRASGSDDALRLVPPRIMSIEEAMEFIGEDELIEITPKSVRMRKAILSNTERMKKAKGGK
ncbi:translational GTPase TypA [Butyricicoccus porcorum]|uniref:Large ribosomal subunit assembly factor BipA n=1 Tax=Butyricicoccus porcorum TaxID=1945634 RepID=A0A252F6K7_9FIRM|nr:translational GTPase TypA [Butyricicoccus porcorum]MCI6925985.1 translational GTPase TypA [Butyricicoccus porcorum]MDD6985776.1 translational GTPase TypA [Butyricicoccus porcorum]MDY4484174.1 translational GTPase TypA [Butyricicoccus porcorum]OUM21290.1 translational GTPase TypA [Butyricicoccus porcorum]